jgi:hypothetical protein
MVVHHGHIVDVAWTYRNRNKKKDHAEERRLSMVVHHGHIVTGQPNPGVLNHSQNGRP